MSAEKSTIYLVATPIGNVEDISKRAVDILSTVDLIACEDTRHSGSFLKRLEIKAKLISYHDFNESSRAQQLVDRVLEGESIAVITDAGTPGISDPAYRIVRLAVDNNLTVVPIPGATALIAAVTASGLPTDRFFFEGFLPYKSGARKNRFKKLESFEHTIVFYESPHRIEKSLNDMLEVLGDRQICLAREITKKFEQFIRGSISEVIEQIKNKPIKGEIVLVVAGADS